MAYELVINNTLTGYRVWRETSVQSSSDVHFGLFTQVDGTPQQAGNFKLEIEKKGENKAISIMTTEDTNGEAVRVKSLQLLLPLVDKNFIRVNSSMYRNYVMVSLDGSQVRHISESLLELFPLLDKLQEGMSLPFGLKAYLSSTNFGLSGFDLLEAYKKELKSRLTDSIVAPSIGKFSLAEDKLTSLINYAKNAGHPDLLLYLADLLERNYGLLESAARVRMEAIALPKVSRESLVPEPTGKAGQTAGTDKKTDAETAATDSPEFKVAKALLDGTVKFPAADLERMLNPSKQPEGSVLGKVFSLSWLPSSFTSSSAALPTAATTTSASAAAASKAPSATDVQERRATLRIVHTLLENFRNALIQQGMKREQLKPIEELLLNCDKELAGPQHELTKSVPLTSSSPLDLLEHIRGLNGLYTTLQGALAKDEGAKRTAEEISSLRTQNQKLEGASDRQQSTISQLGQEKKTLTEKLGTAERDKQEKSQACEAQKEEITRLRQRVEELQLLISQSEEIKRLKEELARRTTPSADSAGTGQTANTSGPISAATSSGSGAPMVTALNNAIANTTPLAAMASSSASSSSGVSRSADTIRPTT